MDDSNKSASFSWRTQVDAPALPVDYSAKESGKRWGYHHDTVGTHIIKNPIFNEMYQWQRYFQYDPNERSKYNNNGIPVELEPFFHEFMDQVIDHGLMPDAFKNKDTLDKFNYDFSLHLHRLATSSEAEASQKTTKETHTQIREEAVSSNLYLYRQMYKNNGFQKSVTKDYWDCEFDWRCQAIKELSQNLPLSEQVDFLKDMINTLDVKLGYLLTRNKQLQKEAQSPPNNSFKQNSFIHSFPIELLSSLRKSVQIETKGPKHPNNRGFEIPNPLFSHEGVNARTLEEAFQASKKYNLSKEAIEHIRDTYLNEICSAPPKCDFQLSCENLQSYLDLYITTPEDINTYKEHLEGYCFTFFAALWMYTPPPDDYFTTSSNQKNVLERYIENTVTSFVRTFQKRIADIPEFIIPWYLNSPLIGCRKRQYAFQSNYVIDGILQSDIPLKIGADLIKHNLQQLWVEELFPVSTLPDRQMSDDEIKQICNEMAKHCNQAHITFCGKQLIWATADTFFDAWKRYYEIQNSFTADTVIAYGNILDLYLTYGMLVLRAWVSFQRITATSLDMLDSLTEFINYQKGRPPEATCQDSVTSVEDSKQPGANRSGTGTGQP